MKRFLITATAFFAITTSAYAETIKTSVNGLVCAFCATGIEKTLKAQPEVEQVHVDLETKLVTITTKPSQGMDDAEITKLINDAGYSVTNISRGK